MPTPNDRNYINPIGYGDIYDQYELDKLKKELIEKEAIRDTQYTLDKFKLKDEKEEDISFLYKGNNDTNIGLNEVEPLKFNIRPGNLGIRDSFNILSDSLNFDADNYDNLTDEQKEDLSKTNKIRGVLSGTSLALNSVKTGLGAYGQLKQRNLALDDLYKKLYERKVNNTIMMEEGGTYPIDEAEVFTGEYAQPLPEEAAQQANAELEGGESMKTPDGKVLGVKGKKHEQGGENFVLEGGTKVLSDDRSVGKKLAEKLSDNFEIDVNKDTTFSEVLTLFEKKIGLTEIVEKEKQLFKDIEDSLEIEDETTANRNLTFFSEQLQLLKEEKLPLEEYRSSLFDFLFLNQEEQKGNLRVNKPKGDFISTLQSDESLKILEKAEQEEWGLDRILSEMNVPEQEIQKIVNSDIEAQLMQPNITFVDENGNECSEGENVAPIEQPTEQPIEQAIVAKDGGLIKKKD